VGRRTGLDWYGKSRPPPGFDPGPSGPCSVAIPTELPGPRINRYQLTKLFFGYFQISDTELTVVKT